jgi:hypothetical protein
MIKVKMHMKKKILNVFVKEEIILDGFNHFQYFEISKENRVNNN